jgi:tetratricopeptide (TPR) repeat protein
MVLLAVTLVAATIITTAQAREAERARIQAEHRFTEVRQLATSFLFDFHDAIATLPGTTAAREMVVKTAEQYLDSLTQEAADDRALTLELSTAYLRLADVEGRPSAARTGDTDAALKNYGRALMLRRRLVTLEPGNTEYQHNLAVALVRMGPIFQVRGDPQSAVTHTREATQIMDRLLQVAPGPDIRRDAFRAPLYVGDALADLGDYRQALELYGKALAIANTARMDPPEADYKHRLAVINERLGTMFMVSGDYAQALASYREALADEQAMRAAEPDNAGYRRLLANGFYHVSDALREEKHYDESMAAVRQALALYEELARADPKNVGAKGDVGGCIQNLAETLLVQGDGRAAAEQADRAIVISRELAAQDPGSVDYRNVLAGTLVLSGNCLLAVHDPAAAIERLDEARRILEPIVASRPQQVVYARGLAQIYTDLGDAHQRAARSPRPRAADWQDAEHWYERALALWQALDRRHALWASESTRPAEVQRQIELCARAAHG